MAGVDLPSIDQFSPQEQAALNYHRQNLIGGTGKANKDGSITTFMGSVIDTNDGAMILPTYWAGSVRSVPDAMNFAIRSGIDFPKYPTVKDALAAEKKMHGVMEQDTTMFRKGKK